MIRTLIVWQPPADFESQTLVRQLLRADAQSIREFRLPPGGAAISAVRRLQHAIEQDGGADVLHAVGLAPLLACAAVGCQPIVYSPPPGEPTRNLLLARRISTIRSVRIAVNGRVAATEFTLKGFAESNISILPPMPREIDRIDREHARRRFGLGGADRVMLAIGESTRSARHEHALWCAVILHYLQPNHRLLLWGRGETHDRVRRFADVLRQPGLCVVAPEREDFSALYAASDVALWSAVRGASTSGLQECVAAGVPVVDISRDRPRVAAQRLLRWFEHPEARAALESRPRDDPSAVESWITLYRDVLVGRATRAARSV